MRISDWSSVLCSSDLAEINVDPSAVRAARDRAVAQLRVTGILLLALASLGVLFGVLLLRRSTRHTDWRTRADPEHRASEPESPTELSDLLFLQRAGATMDALDCGIVSADREGRVRYLNATAERLTGWPRAAAGSAARRVGQGGVSTWSSR